MTIALEKIRAKDYDEWEYRNCGDDDSPCVICGKTVRNYMTAKNVKWLRLYAAGNLLTDDESPVLEDDMGWYPVGATCYKKFLAMGTEENKKKRSVGAS